MRITAKALRDDFLAKCSMLIRTSVSVTEDFDNKKLAVSKNYMGVPTVDAVRRQAILDETDTSSIHPGGVYLTEQQIATFLNTAWEYLHLSKCKEINSVLMNAEVHSTTIESLVYEHDQLYQTTAMLEELEPKSSFWSKNRIDATSNTSILFLLPDEAIKYGPPCIVTCVLHEFQPTTAGAVYPLASRVCRPVSGNEITGLINLATNSRYNSGSLCRHRKVRNGDSVCDMVEVFHRDEKLVDGGQGHFWQSGGVFVALGYIQHPKALTVEETTGEKLVKNKKLEKVERIIECAYPHEISNLAAQLAMTGSASSKG